MECFAFVELSIDPTASGFIIGYFCPSPRKGKNKGRLFNDEVCLRCYPQLVPEKIIGHRWAMLILSLLNFAVFVGMQQELHLF